MIHFLRVSFMLVLALIAMGSLFAQQSTNTDPAVSYINVNFPKTPESQGFENFGKTPVNELTGTPDISIPIYTLKSRFLEAPITLAYQATGIKVNQEATWVGLGWDLIAGGRITIETKGTADFSSSTQYLYSRSNLSYGMQRIFHRLGDSADQAILTYASVCSGVECDNGGSDLGDDRQTVFDMAQFGAGQPDIFRANFLGHSLTFFYDKVTGSLRYLHEQSQFAINNTLDSSGNLISWKITDNEGTSYFFDVVETTTVGLPPINPIVPGTSTSAWLLTKVLHPSGDYILFTYSNYGNTYPAFSWSSSQTTPYSNGQAGVGTPSNDFYQNTVIQSPYYLTRMETSSLKVDFVLGSRNDLYGAGSKKLDTIRISDKQTGTIWKKAIFSYSYFTSATDGCHSSLSTSYYNIPAGQVDCSNTRLRLDSLSINNQQYQPPYKFHYIGGVPDKYAHSLDHWGYYNGAANGQGGCGPKSLLPNTGTGSTINNGVLPGIAGYGAYRDCDPLYVTAGALDSISYPTGGSSAFIMEPHQATMEGAFAVLLTGGGLRVKTIKNYSFGVLTGSIDYAYQNGYYMGVLQYFTQENKVGNKSNCGTQNMAIETVNGYINDADRVVAYPVVTITQRDRAGRSNGSLVKVFKVSPPGAPGMSVLPAHWPQNGGIQFASAYSGFPPTPQDDLEDKLMSEQYIDSLGNLKKEIYYYYHQANRIKTFYDIRTFDNTFSCSSGYETYIYSDGNRGFIIFVSPGRSYVTVTDSVVERTYEGSNVLVDKKSYTYNARQFLESMTTTNSDGMQTVTSYKYPDDYVAGTNVYFLMRAAPHIISPIVSTTVTRNGVPVSFTMNNYMYYNGLYIPQNTQVQIGSNPIETRQLYNSYDQYGHPMEIQKPEGAKEDILWGYDHRFPVAHIIGSDSASVAGLLNANILNNPSSDSALKTELNKLRTGLTGALVTTYTYNPIGELTSQTDPRGITSYYEYDGFGRLKWIKDKNGNIIKTMQYHYQSISGVQY